MLEFSGDIIETLEEARSEVIPLIRKPTKWALYQKRNGRYSRLFSNEFLFSDFSRKITAVVNS